VSLFKETNQIIGMCGDGANDCAALSIAQVGIALAKTEASIVSPFSAPTGSPYCVVSLLCEGRASLANSFAAFKFIFMYSVIQTMQVMMAYRISSDLSSGEYVLSDFAFCLPLSFWIIRGLALKTLHKTKPPSHVLGFATLGSLIYMMIISFVTLTLLIFVLPSVASSINIPFIPESLAHPPIPAPARVPSPDAALTANSEGEDSPDVTNPHNSQTTMLFFIGTLLYIFIALAISLGAEWRRPLYTHVGLLLTAVALVFTTLFLMFMPLSWDVAGFWSWCEFVELGLNMKLLLIGISLIALVLLLVGEKVLTRASSWFKYDRK